MRDEKKAFANPCAAFDFDGTLVDSNGAAIRLLERFFAAHGGTMSAEFLEAAKTMNMVQTSKALKAETGASESPEEIAAWIEAKARADYDTAAEKPGACAYVRRLYGRGVRLCVVSATDEEVIRPVLRRLGIEDCFRFILTVSEVGGAGKDKPDIFLEAARRLGVPCGDVTLYDDALEALRSAQRAGLRTVCVYDEAGAATAQEARVLCDGYLERYEW